MLKNKCYYVHLYTMQTLELRLPVIKQLAAEKLEENMRFRNWLQALNGAELDKIVFVLQEQVTSQIDCLACGNCCKTFMISLSDNEAAKLAAFTKKDIDSFMSEFTDRGSGSRIFNKIPCHFLCADNTCSVYEARPNDCRSFPHLDVPGFQQRLMSVIDNYGVCPIVFNVFEQLKMKYGFYES